MIGNMNGGSTTPMYNGNTQVAGKTTPMNGGGGRSQGNIMGLTSNNNGNGSNIGSINNNSNNLNTNGGVVLGLAEIENEIQSRIESIKNEIGPLLACLNSDFMLGGPPTAPTGAGNTQG